MATFLKTFTEKQLKTSWQELSHCQQCWRRSPVTSYESWLVALWCQGSSTSWVCCVAHTACHYFQFSALLTRMVINYFNYAISRLSAVFLEYSGHFEFFVRLKTMYLLFIKCSFTFFCHLLHTHRSVCCHTTRLESSFFPQSVRHYGLPLTHIFNALWSFSLQQA